MQKPSLHSDQSLVAQAIAVNLVIAKYTEAPQCGALFLYLVKVLPQTLTES